jgi:hypothetical protein
MKFLRSSFVLGVVAVLAACGDKVTVAPPPASQTAPAVVSVTVSPATATLNVGQSVTLTAVVDVKNGAAQTVTWASSAANVTVSAAGAATAVSATPGVAVCATATADATKKGCASIVVTAAPAVIPATVSIQSITTNAGGLNAPINPAAVAGLIDVRANVAPGNETVTKIVVQVGTARVDSQSFSAAQAAELRYVADQAEANQSAFPPVIFSVNTAAITNTATGAVRFTNGNYNVSVLLYVGATLRSTATYQTALSIANANTFLTTTTVGGTTAASANNATGFRYNRGDLMVSVVPVSYSGVALASAGVSFGTVACNGLGASAAKAATLTAPAAGSSAWTVTFANSGAAAATNMAGYSFNAAGVGCPAASNNTGEQVSITAAQDATGNPFTTTALPIVSGAGFRVDNLAPTVPTVTMTVPARRNTLSWMTDVVPFNRTTAGAGVGVISTAATEVVGAGGVGLSTDETAVYLPTVGGVAQTSSTGLAESATNAAYTLTVGARDLLGNTSATAAPCACIATFGVDRTIPTIPTLGAPATGTAIVAPATPGTTTFGAFTYSDPATLPAGPSTPSATPARVDITRRTTATASTKWNAASVAFNSTGGPSNFALAGPAIDPGATNTQAYYVVVAFVEDGAANPSLTVTRSYIYDTTAPTGPFSIPVMTTSAGSTGLFTSSITDNLDIASSQWGDNYLALEAAPGAVGARILAPATTFGSFESFTTTASSSSPLPLLRSMQGVAAGVPSGVLGSLLNVTHTVVDRSGLVGGTVSTTNAIPAANLPTLPANPYATSVAFTGATGFSVTNAAVTVDISGNGVAPIVNSVDLTATAVGTVNTALNPFARVEFYVYDAGSNTYRLLGTATTPTVVDNATNRVYTWTVNWNPDAVGSYNNPVAAGVQSIVAIGVNSTHDAVRSAANTNITTTP